MWSLATDVAPCPNSPRHWHSILARTKSAEMPKVTGQRP
jgi:hypothetical protein